MDALLAQNLGGLLVGSNGGRGFEDRTKPRPWIRHSGITKIISKVFRTAGARRARRSTPAKSLIRNIPRGHKIMASDRSQGTTIHRHLCHIFFCPIGCRCTLGTQRTTLSATCTQAARNFVVSRQLTPVQAELVISHPCYPFATRFDALFRDRTGQLILVSWKTGVGATTSNELKAHKAQLAVESRFLQDHHRIKIDTLCIVYLGGTVDAQKILHPFFAVMPVGKMEQAGLYDKVESRMAKK